jgi:uncharacterized protein
MNTTAEIERILAAGSFAVIGASRDPEKYGYLVYQTLKVAGKTVYAVNPNTDRIDNDPCYASLSDLPHVPEVAVMVVPPAVTESAVALCAKLGISQIWMQPGAESITTIRLCQQHQMGVVAGGPCIMVMLKTHTLKQ